MKIALIANLNIAEKRRMAQHVLELLNGYDCEVLLSSQYEQDTRFPLPEETKSVKFLPVNDLYAEADLVIVLGGDGSILEAARRAAPHETPILGINMGHLGYMAELEPKELGLLHRVMKGDYQIEERSMLNMELLDSDGQVKITSYALNEVAISNGGIARLIDLDLYEGETKLGPIRADGLLIATPTGSTAYSMSAGGPVIDPRMRCICVTPVCPHALSSKAVVFPDNACLEVRNTCQREKKLIVTIDGKINFDLYKYQTVRVVRSQLTARLIRLKNTSFYTKLHRKMTETY